MGENVATKADTVAVRSDIAVLETQLYRHLWGMAVGIVGLTVAFVKLTT